MDGHMAKTEEIKAFVKQVTEMRRIQREFFRTRSYAAMQLAKSLEKDVDDRARRLLAALEEETEAEQCDLFAEGK